MAAYSQRVQSWLPEMTLEENVSLLAGASTWDTVVLATEPIRSHMREETSCGKPSRHLSDGEIAKNKNRESHHARSFENG
jgi:hypothetical protein